jgi:hypothetical protein
MVVLVALGCDGSVPQDRLGSITAAIQMPQTQHDVDAVRFDVVAGDGTCDSPALASKTLSLESETLPASVGGPGSGAHPFADALFVLPAGGYLVCATPLHGDGTSKDCAQASAHAEVVAGQTNEVLLVSQCAGQPNGGLDVVAGLNDAPVITGLAITPSKFITTCESAALAVVATDPNGDSLTYAWTVLAGPAGASLTTAGASATFSGTAGDYQLGVTVTDVHAASATLSFPVHVSAATCAAPAAVQAIILAKCSPCHTTGMSGGLSMATAEATYANLVGVHALGGGCMDRIRAVPGSAATSYIIAKLRNTPPICGMPMPRGRPPLPEEEIATIEAWINGLPH